jgi:tRNA threonylcarbamoyl adenosine modification protein YeaZ
VNGSTQPRLIALVDLSASLYIALLDSNAKLLSSRIREQGARGETTHDLLDECLLEAGVKPSDIEALCVGTGPGSFTGIRVGVAIVQGLAFAHKLPIYPFSSLAAMTISAPTITGVLPTAAIAASGGKYFVRGGDPLFERLQSQEELEALASGGGVLITSGRVPIVDRLTQVFSSVMQMEAQANFSAILKLAQSRPPILNGIIRPNYLQASAAEEKRLAQNPDLAPLG